MDYHWIQVFFFLVGCSVARLHEIDEQEVTVSVSDEKIRATVDNILHRYGPNVNKHNNQQRYQMSVLCVVKANEAFTLETLGVGGEPNQGVIPILPAVSRPTCQYQIPLSPFNNANNHAEAINLAHIAGLVSNFTARFPNIVYSYILYTYYSPCGSCADKIVNFMGSQPAKRLFHVVYTKEYQGQFQTTKNKFDNFNQLHNASTDKRTITIGVTSIAYTRQWTCTACNRFNWTSFVVFHGICALIEQQHIVNCSAADAALMQ